MCAQARKLCVLDNCISQVDPCSMIFLGDMRRVCYFNVYTGLTERTEVVVVNIYLIVVFFIDTSNNFPEVLPD